MTTTTVADPAGPPDAEPPALDTAVADRPGRTPLGLFAAVFTLLATIAYTPLVTYEAWTPKAALVPFVIAVGLPLLWAARRGAWRQAAIAGMALVVVATVSAVFAVNRTIGVFGVFGWGTGLVFVAALPAAWAIGTRLDQQGREDVQWALVAGVVANVVIGVLELRFDLSFARLVLVEGRPPGLLGGSVPFAQLLAAGVGLVAVLFSPRRPWTLAFVVVVAAGVQIAGGRFALALLAAAVLWVAFKQRLLAGALFAALAVAGLLLGGLVGRDTDSRSASARVAGSGTSGVTTRLENWKMAAGAIASRPVLGSGPGTYGPATSPRRTLKLARVEGADRLYADAHNLVVEYATTTGLAGLGAFLAFAWFALRPMRGWAAGAALALGAMHGVEPQQIALTPLLFLLVGVATPAVTFNVYLPGRHRLARAARVGGIVVATVASSLLLFGTYHLHQSDIDFTIDQADTGMRVLPRWKEPPALQARNYLYYAIVEDDPELYEQSRRWRLEGARREPTDSQSWTKLGDIELRMLELEAAERHFHAALRANPQSVNARIGLAQVLIAAGRPEDAIGVLEEAQRREPTGRNAEIVEDLLTQAERLASEPAP